MATTREPVGLGWIPIGVQEKRPSSGGQGAKPPPPKMKGLVFGRPMEAADLLYSLHFTPLVIRESEGCSAFLEMCCDYCQK